MYILTLRTDKPEAEIGLYDDEQQVSYEVWHAHRTLAETIHERIDELLREQGKTLADISGIVCFQGPGSFTGLRIGLTVANALAYSFGIPIVAMGDGDAADIWQAAGIARLLSGETDQIAIPVYGSPAIITQPKK